MSKKKKKDEEVVEEKQEEEKKKKEKIPFRQKKIVKLFVVCLFLVSSYTLFKTIDLYTLKHSSDYWYQMKCDKAKKKECKELRNYNVLIKYDEYHRKYLWTSIICFIMSMCLVFVYRRNLLFLIITISSFMFSTLAMITNLG